MRDLEFWRSLRHRKPDEATLLRDLTELNALPLQERLPFLGFLQPLIHHSNDLVRCAAVRCLDGCLGIPAYETLVKLLNDDSSGVRHAAVESLRASLLGNDWARWAHAMFHPREDVRKQALHPSLTFPPPDWWAVYVLPDSATREVAEAKVEALTIPLEALPTILGYVRQGILAAATARRWISRCAWPLVLDYFARWGVREDTQCQKIIDCLDDSDGGERLDTIAGSNPLDELLQLFGDANEKEAIDWLRSLRHSVSVGTRELRQRIVSTLLVAARRTPSASREFIGNLAVLEPRVLLCAWLPVELRRAALTSFYEQIETLARQAEEFVFRLLQSDVCRQPDGTLDLFNVGAALHLFENHPYKRLLSLVPIEQINSAFELDPERSVPFFTLADGSPLGRRYLIREICLQPRARRARLLALLCRFIPSDGLDFLEGIEATVAVEIALELLASGTELSDKKARRIAALLAVKIAAGQIPAYLNAWLARPAPEEDGFALVLLAVLCRLPESRTFDQAIRSLNVPALNKFLKAADGCAGFPYDRELALATAFVHHGDVSIRAWAAARLQRFTPARKDLRDEDRVGLLRAGLCHRLRAEADPAKPDVEIGASLLVSYDLFDEVDAQFARFSSIDPDFVSRLDEEMVYHWRGEKRLPFHGHLWLYRWDDHLAASDRELGPNAEEKLIALLGQSTHWKSTLLRRRVWEAAERLMESWRWAKKDRFNALWTPALATVLRDNLVGDVGTVSARIAVMLRNHSPAHEWVTRSRPLFAAQLTSASDDVRAIFASWIDMRGLEPSVLSPLVEPPTLAVPVIALSQIEGLQVAYLSADKQGAQSIARALVSLGDDGLNAILFFIFRSESVRHIRFLVESLLLWPRGEAFERVAAALNDLTLPAETRYRIGVALQECGRDDVLPALIEILSQPGPTGWFEATDWQWLLNFARGLGWEDLQLEKQLATSPHAHVYDPAIMGLMRGENYSSLEIQNALIAFLECGTERMRELRVQAANWLYKSGNWHPILPLLLQAEITEPPTYPDLFVGLTYDLILSLVRGIMLANRGEHEETFVLNLLLAEGVDTFSREEGLSLLMQSAHSTSVRQRARESVRPSYTREMKLRRVASTFAWGIRVGRELTGKLFGIQMIASEQLGYTRFTENKIYITPLPILRGEMHGREVVRALILHEYGHHMYHRGDEAQAVWKQSETESLQKLLNLVSDEHLERNLRALDRRFGDQLKLLAAYAFQHNAREIQVENLFAALQNRTFEVLSAAPMNVARRYGSVAILNGRVLTLMEKAGLSFARFIRALRMGLGNRHEDPKVEAGLALFKGRFRKSNMPRLYDISKKLREIFGWETDILNSFDQDALSCDESGDWDNVSEGITDAEVQTEVQNSLQGKEKRSSDNTKGGRGLNLGPDEHFDFITKVQPMPHDPAAHASYAQQVTRPAQLLRSFLKKLGIGFQQQRMRLTGKSFDKTRARAVVLKGDPRMLIARELKIRTDLFIGVVVDCSGSMSHNANIEKAKLFGTLIAEAARNYPGVDARLFGFTDQVIYDAGHANRCAIHALNAGGGNNDAAGLWHAALQAKASQRRAKLLVMISDGAPTECTVNALRSLVTRLTKRMKICCAQVGVCPLEHQCFPNYILLDQENVAASVREFGNVMAKLVQKALRGG